MKRIAFIAGLLLMAPVYAEDTTSGASFIKGLDEAGGPLETLLYGQFLRTSTPSSLDAARYANAWKVTHDRGEYAYLSWTAKKSPSQVTAAKKVYVAWLTKMDVMSALRGDPHDVIRTPAGTAFYQASNEFRVDNP